MPEISRFFGIIIKMFFDDHNPPHFHAEYGSDLALIDIRNLSVFSGRLSPRVMGLVIEWATLRLWAEEAEKRIAQIDKG